MSNRIKFPFKLGDSKRTNESEVIETSKTEDFSLSEVVRYGFPYRPTTLAYDPVQKILAIGTKHGVIKIYGGAFVECTLTHPTAVEIVQLVFRINEGALISACRDNYIHLWSLRQKKPVIANSLRFIKEKISRCFLPLAFNSKWLLVGTYGGNVYVVNLDTFTLSSYKIMWNNAIGMGKSTHPGVVVALCQNPDDPTRLYIGFSTHLSKSASALIGQITCWNLQQKVSEGVYTIPQGLTSFSWHHEGRQFMCSHFDGSLSVWNLRTTDKPIQIDRPHSHIGKEESIELGPISKVVWCSIKNSNETFNIFSGGMPLHFDQQQSSSTNSGKPSSKPSSYYLTILRGQKKTVLQMDNSILDFQIVTRSPHVADIPDPTAAIVLLENNVVIVDLKSDNYPLFESLHTLDLHESPVTYCDYITEPNESFYQNLLRLQSKQAPKRSYSQQENPISGGRSGSTIFGYYELIITGHADGSIKFWDASGCNLSFLYKLRTNRLFDRVPSTTLNNKELKSKLEAKSSFTNSNTNEEQIQINFLHEIKSYENPFAIYSIKMCCDGKYLTAAATGGHVTLFKFAGSELEKADEGLGDLSCLEIPILHRNLQTDHGELNPSGNLTTIQDLPSTVSKQTVEKKEFKSLLRAKMGYRRMAGYQPELVCLLSWLPTDKIPLLTDISINSKYGLLIFGLENGLVVIDYLSQYILMNMATGDLYGTMDPFQRSTISPKRRAPLIESNTDESTPIDHQHQTLNVPSHSTETGASSNIVSLNDSTTVPSKDYLKPTRRLSPRNRSSENNPTQIFRSRSIDSMSGNEQTKVSRPSVEMSTVNDDKPPSIATFARTFRTLRKRLSRTSISHKSERENRSKRLNHLEKDCTLKSSAEESEASSTGEDQTQLAFGAIPTSNPDLTQIDPTVPSTCSTLKEHRSLPLEKIPTNLPSQTLDPKTKNTENSSSDENSNLAKTWSPSSFTGAQLRGTCSIEYTEHMKDKSHKRKAHMIDLRKDNAQQSISPTHITSTNKSMGGELPRSPSISSLDTIITNESICVIQFSESFTYKNDPTLSPSVWLGTSTGCVIVINLNIIYEPRNISVVPSGSVFRLRGRLLHISFLDHKGAIIPTPSEKWDTKKQKTNRLNDGFAQSQDLNSSTVLPLSSVMSSGTSSSTSTTNISNNVQYAVFCSSKQARVISLPSQTCISKQKIYDSSSTPPTIVLRAAVVKVTNSPCLTCYLSNGRINVYSLPSLRELFTTNLDLVADSFKSLIASTFTFTNRGHGLYMCSPTEIQKITIASDIKEQISDMLCDLYSPSIAMPEAPRQNFFAKLFTTNSILDSDQLFGDAAGKAPFGIIKKEDVNLNMNQMRGKVDSATGVVNDTRMKLIERGQKLSEVELATKQLSDRSEEFATLTHKVLLKQKEKAEWWPFTSKKS